MFEAKTMVTLIEGLSLKRSEAQIGITFDDEFLIIEEKEIKLLKFVTVNTFKIPLKNIIDCIVTTKQEIVDANKSVIKRGVVGGLVFGPAGLVLGGMSGIGTKKKTKIDFVFIVSYFSSEGEIKNIIFNTETNFLTTKSFNKKLNKKLHSIEKSEEVKKILDQSVQEQNEFLL